MDVSILVKSKATSTSPGPVNILWVIHGIVKFFLRFSNFCRFTNVLPERNCETGLYFQFGIADDQH
jgi:hypothetical protein